MSLPGKRILQSTFDEVVRESVEDLEMEPDEAISDAIEQFKAQGVELNNIVTNLVVTTDGTSWHPVINSANKLKTIDINDKNALHTELDRFRIECEKSLAHRVLATSQSSAYLTLTDIYGRLESDSSESKVILLKALSSFLNGQPDCVTDKVMDMFIRDMLSKNDKICLYACRLVRLSCTMHETNRQTFVAKGVITKYVTAMTKFKDIGALVIEVCQGLRTLTMDDDPRVPFGKAHDHAKMIVMEGGALEILLDISKGCADDSVLGELFSTLGRLAVRNEFCQAIVDLGGLDLMLTVLQTNMRKKDICSRIIGVFKAIAGNDNVKVALAKSNTPSLIVEAINCHQSYEALCTNACACLATIALRNPANVKVIIESNGHIAVVQSMKVHPSSVSLQKQACIALRNLVARSKENCTLILALGAEELINKAMQLPDVKDEAKAALRDLDCKVELVERWKGEKGSLKH